MLSNGIIAACSAPFTSPRTLLTYTFIYRVYLPGRLASE